jgi:hypothetical protein
MPIVVTSIHDTEASHAAGGEGIDAADAAGSPAMVATTDSWAATEININRGDFII